MFDSDNPDAIPVNAIAATYSDLVPNLGALAAMRSRFPLGLVLIDRHGDPTGQASVLDVEGSLHSVADAAGWFDTQEAAGVPFLTVYGNRSTYPSINTAMGDRNFYRWITTLDGTMYIGGYRPGKRPALVQFAGETQLGFHCDCSVIWADGWHPEFPPVPQNWPGVQPVLDEMDDLAAHLVSVRNEIGAHL
jgi:hypothetical protein